MDPGGGAGPRAPIPHADRGALPQYIEELGGIARGSGLPFNDVLAMNVRTELIFAAKARLAREQRGECSSFAILPARSVTGHTVIGQNWDWLPDCADSLVVLEAVQMTAPRSLRSSRPASWRRRA
ncbi:MAG: hypothetical protein M5T61_10210 [Acidimicrobiia bacterium]|nr:hypothetical protein [Acidimicrobiia bacterium]